MSERTERSLVERALLMRDVIDGQLESADRLRIGRVADVVVLDPTRPRVGALVVGPEALAGRLHAGLRAGLHRLLQGRWERAVDVDELEELGPTLRLRQRAEAYGVASGERWIGERIVRRLPGAGRWPPPHQHASAAEGSGCRAGNGGGAASSWLRGADLIGARVVGPRGDELGEVLDVELRPKDEFALDGLIVADEPAIARLVLLRQVGPRPGGRHLLVPWQLVGAVDGRTIRLTALPEEARPAAEAEGEAAAAEGEAVGASGEGAEAEGEAVGASPASAVGERARSEPPAEEDAGEPERRERRARQ